MMGATQASQVRLVLEDRSCENANLAKNAAPPRFDGTDNPRERRLLAALLRGPLKREQADRVAGASNAPEWISRLRKKGLGIPCTISVSRDRDGRPCRPGTYSFVGDDHRSVVEWMEREGLGVDDLANTSSSR